MNDFDEILQKARQAWLLKEIKVLDIKYPTAEISKKTGYSKGTVSNYLTGKGFMSLEFIKTFCEKYGYSFETINASIVADLANPITEKSEEKNKEILSTDNDNLLASHHTKNDEPMTDRLIDLLQKQHEGLLQAHRELIAKITNITLDEKKEFGKSPKHPAH